jgi:hypothetical protein
MRILALSLAPSIALAWTPSTTVSHSGVTSMESVDIDGDGDTDLVTAGSSGTSIFLNVDGVLTLEATIDTGNTEYVHFGDADGDLDLDIAYGSREQVGWLENDGGWTDHEVAVLTERARGVAFVDLDLDGDLDLYTAQWAADDILEYLNDGTGTFAAGVAMNANQNAPRDLDVADVTGDGNPDLLCGTATTDRITWFEAGTGTSGGADAASVDAFDVGDLNGDGAPDAIVMRNNSHLNVLFGNGAGFDAYVQVVAQSDLTAIAADIDGDDIDDLIVLDTAADVLRRYDAEAGGASEDLYAFDESASHPTALDIDGDTDLDIVVEVSGGLLVLENERIDDDGDNDGITTDLDCDDTDPGLTLDSDGDGSCDEVDLCLGDDAEGDTDSDGVCDLVLSHDDLVAGQGASIDVRNAQPGAQVAILAGTRESARPLCHPNYDMCTDIAGFRILASGTADDDGVFSADIAVPDLPGITVLLQAGWFDPSTGAAEDSALIETTVDDPMLQ